MICNGCGRLIPDDATECNYCFEKVKKIDIEKYKKSFMPKRNVKELTIAFLLMLILVVIGIIIYNNIKNFTSGEGIKERKSTDSNTTTSRTIDTIDAAKDVVNEYNKKIESMDKVMQ